jgi:malate dehydrogenase
MGEGGTACVEHAGQVRADDVRPLFRRHLGGIDEDADAGVVDENVQPAETRDGRVHRTLDVLVAAHVGAQRLDARRAGALEARPRLREMRFRSPGNRDVDPFRREHPRDRETDAARAAGDDRSLPAQIGAHSCHYNSPRMQEVAIIGAGELGGDIAHALARRDLAMRVRLLDPAGDVAAGKALDILQAAPIASFTAHVSGAADIMRATAADAIVLADRVGTPDWTTDELLLLLKQLRSAAAHATIVCAGAAHRSVVARAVGELGIPARRIVGSAPHALAAAIRALVALECNGSPRDVSLSVLGVPPDQIVVPWEDATVGGFAATRVLGEPARRRVIARLAPLWPPGPAALAHAACDVLECLFERSRQMVSCFVAPDEAPAVRSRVVAMPVRLNANGVARIERPTLSGAAQVALENAMLL